MAMAALTSKTYFNSNKGLAESWLVLEDHKSLTANNRAA
jgi:hypothetical protein